MTAIKITPKTFSGGALKQLPDIVRGLAIDNAKAVFNTMPLEELAVKNQMLGVMPVTLTEIPIPKKGGRRQEIPATFWDMADDARKNLQRMATPINVVLERFGLPAIQGASGKVGPIEPVFMTLDDTSVVQEEENFGPAMGNLRDGMTCIAHRINDIRVALGGEKLFGNTGGSMKCVQIYPAMVDRIGLYGTDAETVANFLEAFNSNLAFVACEWNRLVGVSEDNFEAQTNISFDDAIMSLPAVSWVEAVTDAVGTAGENVNEYLAALDHLAGLVRCLEIQVEAIGERFAVPVASVFTDIEYIQGTSTLMIGAPTLPDLPGEVIRGGNEEEFVRIHGRINDALTQMVQPLNYALAMDGHTPVVDVHEPQEQWPETYDLPCVLVADAIMAQYRATCVLAKAVTICCKVETLAEENSLHVLAG